jgi:hypothetical protein
VEQGKRLPLLNNRTRLFKCNPSQTLLKYDLLFPFYFRLKNKSNIFDKVVDTRIGNSINNKTISRGE